MLDTVHVKLEKIAGPFKGEIEGTFIWDYVQKDMDKEYPLIFVGCVEKYLIFRHNDAQICLEFMYNHSPIQRLDYIRHFEYGVNFLIKEWSYGSGERININQSPN